MDLDQLRMFAEVAKLGNLTQAAQHLNLSQAAASARIRSLEEEFGVALFERKPGGLALTRNGRLLLPMIQGLLATANEILAGAKSFNGRVTGPIKLAAVAAVFDRSFLRFGEMLSLIATNHPHLGIALYQRSSREVWVGVEEDAFDVGLAFGDGDIPGVRRIPLRVVPYRVVAPATWDASMRRAPWKELALFPWITCPMGGKHHDMAMQLFRRFDCQPSKFIYGEGENVITALVAAGMGLGLMREGFALEKQACGKILVVDNMRPSAHLQIIYRTSRENDVALRAMVDVLSASRD
jgi:molybdate transport repressor ModE-like protein